MLSDADEQRERRETFAQDLDLRRRQEREQQSKGATYLDHYRSELGGRFSALETEIVTGRPSPQPPPLPASSPWAGEDPVGIEPPLGYAVDEMVPLDLPTVDPAARDTGGAADASSGSLCTDVEHAALPLSHGKEKGDG
jgi:hypothetical protein